MQTVLEFAVAGLYLVGAAFNATYTLRNSGSFYRSLADGAWLGPASSFTRRVVIPNGRVLTVALIAFQVSVAVLILTRGELASVGLIAGAGFSFVVALFSNRAGSAANLGLAALQAWLAAQH